MISPQARPYPQNPLIMNLPILYIKRGCPWCDEAIDYLNREKIEVRTVNVSADREAMREMVDLSGQSKAPTLDWHGEVLADFGVDELVPFLKKRGVV
jgi:glutaredoxin 3